MIYVTAEKETLLILLPFSAIIIATLTRPTTQDIKASVTEEKTKKAVVGVSPLSTADIILKRKQIITHNRINSQQISELTLTSTI